MLNMIDKTIPINIWDDYYEDGYVPEGKIQETYIYVEDNEIPHIKRKEYLEKILQYMNENLNLEGINLSMHFYDSAKEYPEFAKNPEYENLLFKRWKIKVEHLTHKRLSKLVEELNEANLSADGVPFQIYSES